MDIFVEDLENAIKKKDVVKEMAEAEAFDPKSRLNPISVCSITGLSHPISPPESQMFQICMAEPLSPSYNSFVSFKTYPMDSQMLLLGLEIMADRHDILRTSYHMGQDAKGVKRISRSFLGDAHALSTTSEMAKNAIMSGVAIAPFALGISPARCVTVAVHNDRKKSTDEVGVDAGICMHHIVADGDGVGNAGQELDLIYNLLFRGFSREATMERLAPITVQFQDYSYWLTSIENTGVLRDDLAMYMSQIVSSSPPDVLDLPINYPRQRAFKTLGASNLISMSQDLLDPVLKLVTSTPYDLVFTYFSLSMCRLSNRSDHIVANTWGTRPFPSLYSLIGSFINMLPFHFNYHASESLGTALDRMKQLQLYTRKHSLASFLTINNNVRPYNNPTFDPSRNPVYQTMLDLVPFSDEYSFKTNGIMDLFCFVFAPGGSVQFLESVYNTTIMARSTSVAFLNQAKSIAMYAGIVAAGGDPESLHLAVIPERFATPELGTDPPPRITLATFALKLNLFDEEHDDITDDDCEISLISGPEPEGVPDEYDFFRRNRVFLQCSCIVPTINVSNEFAIQYQQPPLVEPRRGQPIMVPTPQSTEVDENYEKIFSEPQLDWSPGPSLGIATPNQEMLEGEIKFFDIGKGHGVIIPADESKDEVMFTTSSIPIKDRPTKMNGLDLAGRQVCFMLVHGINEKYATGIRYLAMD